MSRPTTRRSFLLAAGAGGIGLATGFVGGAASASDADTSETDTTGVGSTGSDPSGSAASAAEPTSIDIGFCTDMTVHHVQALAMCQRVLGRDTGDPVQAAAVEVLQTQAIEVGMMRAWLTDWGQSTAEPELAMGWMGMNDGAGMPVAMMPGLATDDEMRALGTATGAEQGRLWLELMRAHHVGGVAMAEAAIELASLDKVRRIAQVQVDVQTYEISQYDLLLADF